MYKYNLFGIQFTVEFDHSLSSNNNGKHIHIYEITTDKAISPSKRMVNAILNCVMQELTCKGIYPIDSFEEDDITGSNYYYSICESFGDSKYIYELRYNTL